MRSRSTLLLLILALVVPPALVATGGAAASATGVDQPSLEAVDGELEAQLTAPGLYRPGDEVTVTGAITRLSVVDAVVSRTPVRATFSLVARTPEGEQRGRFGPFETARNGTVSVTLPGSITEGVEGSVRNDHRVVLALDVVDVVAGTQRQEEAGSVPVEIQATPEEGVVVDASYVSATGWVYPGAAFPFRVFVRNYTDAPATGVTVTVTAPDDVRFTNAVVLGGGEARVEGGGATITWQAGDVPPAAESGPGFETLVVEAEAATLAEDPEIAWKDLSSTARMTYDGGDGTSRTHGPKVIPPDADLETARYGDKPFPMVPAEYVDRKHRPENTGDRLDTVVNDPGFPGSTFNLYQEMSYGQLFPEGTVGSAGVATAGWDYEPGFDFTTRPADKPQCRGTTLAQLGDSAFGSPLLPERISDGWYQLPGDTEYYGGDDPAFTLNVAGGIDQACGQLGKAVFDAAQIADPEIDYNEYDSDKDGVVDFFMLLFVGCGGNGDSQLAPAQETPATNGFCETDDVPYDNIWPHSSTLEMQYRDPETGLRGYTSDDQLRSLEEVPQCWLDENRVTFDDCAAHGGDGQDDLPVFVRVGPYNVNPETAISSASVISHEYGHHLGLPDFYSSDQYYADLNLMAADYAQHMTIFSKQDMGWVVPQFLQPGETRDVEGWTEIKRDTGRITWRTPDGKPYTLSAANGDQNIHNGEAYGLKLPKRILIDPKKVAEQASATHVWYSGRGNDFGCSPTGGHNLDILLSELADVPAGTPVTLEFKSSWDIEWDWDYGFVLTTTDGVNYTSQPSENGYTTQNLYNPNSQQCFEELDNGITGQSGAYQAGPAEVTKSRNPAANEYDDGSPFLVDAYDISELAGQRNAVVRFSYFTDAAFDRPGWFIDDVVVRAGDEVIYSSDMESGREEGRIFSGGCGDEGMKVAVKCTDGWRYVDAAGPDSADHAYYLELRDQTGFDFNGHGQSDRGDTSWEPGVFIEYTDENHGYGNNGVPPPPSQHYLDSQPMPGTDCVSETDGNCADASFTAAEGDRHFSDAVNEEQPGGWIDNFTDPDNDYDDDLWHFDYGCLTLDVRRMSGQKVGPDPEELGSGAPLSDLTADARLSAGEGCVRYTFTGAAAEGEDLAPEAVAQAKPTEAEAGERVTFDGSRSSDDRTPTEQLHFEWDLDGDGSFEAEGQVVHHRYQASGTYQVTLRVTDSGLQSDTDTVQVRVSGGASGPSGDGSDLPTTGGGAALFGLLAVACAGLLRRRQRS